MPGESVDQQAMQDRMIQSMKEFEAENPDITEAMAVMNMTMPDYCLAMESILGGQIVTSTSSYAAVPLQANS